MAADTSAAEFGEQRARGRVEVVGSDRERRDERLERPHARRGVEVPVHHHDPPLVHEARARAEVAPLVADRVPARRRERLEAAEPGGEGAVGGGGGRGGHGAKMRGRGGPRVSSPPMPRHVVAAALAAALALAGGRARAQTFLGLAEGGATFSQVDGDELAGFNRLGARAGVGVLTDLADKWRASLVIAYAQHGANASARDVPGAFDRIRLDYVAVPVVAHYLDWLSDDERYYRLEFVGGLEYRRLVAGEATAVDGTELERDFSDNALALAVGVYYAWSLDWAAGAFYDLGVTDAQADPGEAFQQTKQLSLRLRRLF